MNIIKIDGLTKEINKQIVLKDISFTIKENEIIGLIGPSGAGKTSLVKAIMGMLKIDKGKIILFEKYNVPTLDVLYKIGYMAQNDALYTTLSARNNFELFAGIYGLNKNETNERIKYVCKLVNLENELSKKVANYSGGMKRRLSFGLALLHDPDLLILDEPTVGLDPLLKKNIWKELVELRKNNKTIIITTHAMDEAMQCDKLFLMRDGQIIAYGSPGELLKLYKCTSIDEIFIKIGEINNEN